jgi:hypothetical protein
MEKFFFNKDNDYKLFEKKYLVNERYTFEEITNFFEILKHIDFIKTEKNILEEMRTDWNKLANNWNKEREYDDEDCIIGYMGLAFLYLVLPIDKIKNLEILNDEIIYISILNLIYYNRFLNHKNALKEEDIQQISIKKNIKEWLEDQTHISILNLCHLYFKKYFFKKNENN